MLDFSALFRRLAWSPGAAPSGVADRMDGRDVHRAGRGDVGRAAPRPAPERQAVRSTPVRQRAAAVVSSSVLPSFDILKLNMGRKPKADLKVLCFDIERSARYKAAGMALDRYHDVCAQDRSTGQRLEALAELHQAVLVYLDRHPGTKAMEALLTAVHHERARLLDRAAQMRMDTKAAVSFEAFIESNAAGPQIASSRLPGLFDRQALRRNFERPQLAVQAVDAVAHVQSYDDIEAAADRYQSVVAASRGTAAEPQAAILIVRAALEAYEMAIDHYVSHAPASMHSEPNALVGYMAEFKRDFIGAEKALCADVQALLDDAGPGASMSAGHLLDLRRSAVHVAALREGLRARHAAEDFDWSVAAAIARAGVPVLESSVTVCAKSETMSEIGSGSTGTVYAVTLAGTDGEVRPALFKPENPGGKLPDAAEKAGIPLQQANLTGRYVASSLMDEMLGTRLLVRAQTACVNGTLGALLERASGTPLLADGSVQYPIDAATAEKIHRHPAVLHAWRKQQGFSSAFRIGNALRVEATRVVPASKSAAAAIEKLSIFTPLDIDDAQLRERLTDLQWLDLVNGEVDRGPYNIFQQLRDGKFDGITGIDSDASFGVALKLLGQLVDATNNQRSGVPPVIGVRLFDQFRAMSGRMATTLDTLRPHLSSAELEAHRGRLGQVTEALLELERSGRVVHTPQAWLSDETTRALGIAQARSDFAQTLARAGAAAEPAALKSRVYAKPWQTAKETSYVARETLNQSWARWAATQAVESRREVFLDIDRLKRMLDDADSAPVTDSKTEPA